MAQFSCLLEKKNFPALTWNTNYLRLHIKVILKFDFLIKMHLTLLFIQMQQNVYSLFDIILNRTGLSLYNKATNEG